MQLNGAVSLFLRAALVVMVVGCSSTGSDSMSSTVSDAGGQCNFCAEGEDCCDGFCVNTRTSALSCGGCGVQCNLPTGNECVGGNCVCNGTRSCTEGEFCCDTGCSDPMTDSQNCGGCGNACGDSEACDGGVCVCAAAGGVCDSADACCGVGCVNTQTNVEHCGGCDSACGEGSAVICEGGECGCSAECPAETLLEGCCGDSCVDLCSDAANCGACGNGCGLDEDSQPIACELGVCEGGFEIPNFECLGGLPI